MESLACPKCSSLIYVVVENGPHHEAKCADCDTHIKFVAKPLTASACANYEFPFGKWKGVKLSDIPEDYLQWAQHTMAMPNKIKEKIKFHLQTRDSDFDKDEH